MTLKSAPYWWVVCARCDANSTDGGEFSAWHDKTSAVAAAEDMDYVEVLPNTWLCRDCWLRIPYFVREEILQATELTPGGLAPDLARAVIAMITPYAQPPESHDNAGGSAGLRRWPVARPDHPQPTARFEPNPFHAAFEALAAEMKLVRAEARQRLPIRGYWGRRIR